MGSRLSSLGFRVWEDLRLRLNWAAMGLRTGVENVW